MFLLHTYSHPVSLGKFRGRGRKGRDRVGCPGADPIRAAWVSPGRDVIGRTGTVAQGFSPARWLEQFLLRCST